MAQPEKLEAGRTASPRNRQLGRPTVDRTAAIDAAIRESALAIFLELGFDGASMDAVAAQAGVSKGTLYARFANKEVLFRAILAEEFGRWSKRAEGEDHLLPAALGPRLRHHARSMAEAYAQPEHARIYRLIQTAAIGIFMPSCSSSPLPVSLATRTLARRARPRNFLRLPMG